MSVESLIQAGQKGYANIHDNDFYFSDSNFKEIGENEELTKFFMKQVDPDGSKYGGDVEKAKTGFLNDYTFKSNSIWGEIKGAVQSANYSEEEKQQKNFLQRMYDTAPNRLTGSDGVGGAAQAMGYGLAGGLVGEDTGDFWINLGSTALSSLAAAKMGAAAGTAVAPGVGTVLGGALGAMTGGALALFGKGALLKGTQQLTKEGAKQLLKQTATKEGKDALVKQVAKEYGWNTAKAEIAVNGALGGIGGAAEEVKNENLGLSEGSYLDYLRSVGGGALMAGSIGGALGYMTSRFGEGRRLGKELVQDTRDGQKIMATIGDDGPRTYREAIEQRLKDIEEKEKPTQDEIVQKQQLEAEKKLYDKYHIPLTDDERVGVNDLCADLSNQLRQEANELDTFPSTSGHSPEKLRAVADMLDNLLDFNSAEKAVVDAEKALVGGGDDARANLARVKAKWSALRSIGKYLNDNKLGERDSVYSLIDDATFMDFAKNLDDNVKNAIIAENKRAYPGVGLRQGEDLQPQTPVAQPKATQAKGTTKPQPDTKASRKKAEKVIKDNQSGKSATKIIQELKQEAQANPEESALATMTPDEIQGLQPTLEDVIGGMPKEQASTITQMSQSSVKPDGTPSEVTKSVLDAIKSIPEDEAQFNQLVANLSQQSGLPAEQIGAALKSAKQSYATKVTELEGQLADLRATNEQILETLKQKVSEGTDTTEAAVTPTEPTPPKKTHEQISREAKKKRDELHAEAEMTKADKDETVKRLSQSVSKTREVFASKEAEVTGLIQDGMSLEDFKGSVPERLQPLIEGVTDMATARTVIKENAQRLADYSILSSINRVVGSENLVLFKKFLPLFGDDKDAVRLAKRLDDVVAGVHSKALNEADGENFNSALTSAINNSLLPLKGARKGRINPVLEAAKWLPEKVDDNVKAKVESLAKRVARSCENNAQFKKLPEESQNSIKVHLIQKRVQDYLANRAKYEGVKDSVAQDIQKAFKDVEALKGQKFDNMQDAMSAITSAEARYRYVQTEDYMKSKLDAFFDKYEEPANLAPHQKEEGGKPVYDDKGNLIDVEKKKGVVDEKGNAVYETRYKQVNLNTSSSRYNLRKNFDQVKANVLSSASNRKARKDTIEIARKLNPEAVASLERKTAVVKAGQAPTIVGLDENGKPVKLEGGIEEGKKKRISEIEQLLRIQKPLEGESRTQAEARVKEIDARIEEINKLHGRDRDPYRNELANIRAEKDEVVKHLAVKQATSELVVENLTQELKELKTPDVKKVSSAGITEKEAEGIILDGMFDRIMNMREKQILDRLVKNMIDGTEDLDEQAFEEIGRKFWNTKFTTNDKQILKEVARAEFKHGKEREAIHQRLLEYVDKEKLTNADKQTIARIVEGLNRMLKEQHGVVMEIKERGAKNVAPSVNDSPRLKTTAQDIVLDDETGKLLIYGKEYGTFTRNEAGHIVVTNKAGNTLSAAESVEVLMGRKNFQKILKKAQNEKAREAAKTEKGKKGTTAKKESAPEAQAEEIKPAVTAEEIMEEVNADAVDEINEREAVKSAETARSIADSASTFTSEDLDKKISDYYSLITEDQFITARVELADGSVSWKHIWKVRGNDAATMRTALGNYQKQIDLGNVTIMGCPLRGGKRRGADSGWCAQNAFYLTPNKSGKIDPNYTADKKIDKKLKGRIEAIEDTIGKDDPLTHLKAMDYPLEEKELKKVFFKGDNGEDINGLDFINSFEQRTQNLSIKPGMTRDAFELEVSKLSSMARLINEKLPYGYRKNNSSRINSARHLLTRMKGLNPSEKISALRAFQQLNKDLVDSTSPYVFSGKDKTASGFGYEQNVIVNKKGDRSDKILLPDGGEGIQWTPAVSHEILHWGFTNILTPDEQIRFLENCSRKYFNEDGTLNTKLAEKIGGSKEAVFKQDGSLDVSELFAYEGTGYYGDRVLKQASEANDSFWDMLVTKFKDLISWIQGMRDDISPENIELFEKILPSEYNSNRYEKGILYDLTAQERVAVSDLDPKTNMGVHGLNLMNNLEKVRAEVFKAMFDPNVDGLERAETMKSVASYLKGLLHGSRTEIGSDYVKRIRGKIIGYADQIKDAEGNRLIETKLKTNNLFIKGKRDNKEYGTILDVYKERYQYLGYSEKEAEQMAQEAIVNDTLNKAEKGDSLYEVGELFDDTGEEKGYRATQGQSLDADTKSLLPDQVTEIKEQALKETLAEANKWLKVNGKPEVHSDAEFGAAFESGVIPRDEMEKFFDFHEKRIDELTRDALAELGGNTPTGTAPKVNSTVIQKMLGRMYDIIVDAEDSVTVRMQTHGYALAPNERHRPSVAPKGEKFTPPSKPSGPKTPEVNVVKESVDAKALLGETNGVPNLASPKIKAVLDSLLSTEKPQVRDAIRGMLYRYSELLGKDDLTIRDVANLLDGELREEVGLNPSASFIEKPNSEGAEFDFYADAISKLKTFGLYLTQGARSDVGQLVAANLDIALGDSISKDVLEDGIKYIFDTGATSKLGRETFKGRLMNLPENVLDGMREFLKTDDLKKAFADIDFEKGTEGAFFTIDGKKVPVGDVVQTVYNNLAPEPSTVKAYTPITGAMDTAIDNGYGQNASSAAVQIAALSKGCTPAQAEIMGGLIPTRIRNWWTDSPFKKMLTAMDNGVSILLSSNTKRCKDLGANFLADTGRFFYEDKSLFIGKHWDKLQTTLRELRGSEVQGRSRLRNQIGNDFEDMKRSLLTNNHLGIVTENERGVIEFMRTATNDNWQRKWDNLNEVQRNAVTELTNQFEAIRKEMVDLGIQVNDYRGMNGILHYLPQRFNKDWVTNNHDKFLDGMTKFFMSEGKSQRDAVNVAESLYSHIANDFEFSGFSGTDPKFARKSGEGLYARVLNIKPEQWKEFGLTDMFDNNLEALARDYIDHAGTLIERTKRWGVEGHGRAAYFAVQAGGIDGAANVLMHRQKVLKDSTFKGADNARLSAALDVELFGALTNDVEEAKKICESIETALNDGVPTDNIVNTLVQLYAANRGAGLVHFQREMNCLVNGIKDFGLSVGPNAKIPQKHAKYLVQASDLLTGMRGAPKDDSAAIGWMTSLNNMTMLSMATVASLSDVGLIAVRSGEVTPFLKGIKATMKQMAGGDQAERDAIRSLGVQFETDRMNNFLNNNNGRIQGMNNAFFKATGLTQWTAFSRQMSANVGFEAVKCFQRQAREAIASGNQNSLTYRKAMYWLRTLGLNDPEFINGRALTNYADLIEACKTDPSLESMNEKVARAVVKFVNQSAFAPNRADTPAWAQSGFGRLVFQFKSYPLMLGRLTKWALDSARLKNGANIKPLVLLATLGVGMGAGGQALRDVISGRNIDYEDDDQSFADMHSVKQRLASEICRQMGWESWADSLEGTEADSIIGWYASGLMGLGALGVIGDFAFNLTESTQDGAYGELNFMKQIFGPSAGTLADAYHVVKTGYNMTAEGLGIKGERPSNKDERRAFSVLESRIPIVGGFRSVGRELKDYLVPLEEN